jgi:putative phosphoesterase
MANLSFEWTKKQASQKTKEYLKNLPSSISFQAEGRKVLLFHATPGKNNLYWYEERPEKFFLEMAGKVQADIMIFGHTHKPYRKDIEGKVFINAGSVGKPKDGDPRACVTLMEITTDAVTTNFLRVPYNIEAMAGAIIERGLPAYFAERLKEAR